MNDAAPQKRSTGLLSVIVALALLVSAGGGIYWLLTSGPRQQKEPRVPTTPTVEVQALEAKDRPVSVEAFGTVEPARQVTLSPEVEGRVVEMHPSLEPGARVKAGEVLIRVDPSNYRVGVQRALAALEVARAEVAMEKGNKRVAEREWSMFRKDDGDLEAPEASRSLAVREPQMRRATALVKAAQAELADARLLLKRTTLAAPFDAFVSEESVEIGRRVSPSTSVVTLVGTETFWATVTLPVAQAARLGAIPADAPVEVSLKAGLGEESARKGRFVRRLPDVDSEGRMARALVAIDDPMGADGGPPIPLGSFVHVRIDAGVAEDTHLIPREALRENGQVWVRDAEGKLRFRPVVVVWRLSAAVLARGEFEEGDALVTSYISNPLPGIAVKVRGDK